MSDVERAITDLISDSVSDVVDEVIDDKIDDVVDEKLRNSMESAVEEYFMQNDIHEFIDDMQLEPIVMDIIENNLTGAIAIDELVEREVDRRISEINVVADPVVSLAKALSKVPGFSDTFKGVVDEG